MSYVRVQLRYLLNAALQGRRDEGASVVEYAMLLAMIAIVAVIAVGFVGEPVSEGLSAGGQGFAGN